MVIPNCSDNFLLEDLSHYVIKNFIITLHCKRSILRKARYHFNSPQLVIRTNIVYTYYNSTCE